LHFQQGGDRYQWDKEDVKIYIHNTNTAFNLIYQSWIGTEISTLTKVNSFRRDIMCVHPYGWKIWKAVKTTTQNLPKFINRCLRKMCEIVWSNIIYNEYIWGMHKKNQWQCTVNCKNGSG
jgi:hypothetical protein